VNAAVSVPVAPAAPLSRHRLGFALVVAASLALSAIAVGAQSTKPPDQATYHPATSHAGSTSAVCTQGEVRKLDTSTRKVRLGRGRIENPDMPDVPAVFRVTDPTLLAGLTEGDKACFAAGPANGTPTVSTIERAE